MDYTKINSNTIDNWVRDGWQWGVPISPKEYMQAQHGNFDMLLTPTKFVPKSWIGDVKGKNILGLASGGAQQMPIFVALGANVTVLDYSKEQLKSEENFAVQMNYKINLVNADMTQPLPFEDESFDIIFHPVSNCYVEDVYSIWKECYRVLKTGGLLLAGLDNGINFLIDEADESKIVNKLPFNPLKDDALYEKSIKNNWGIQFSHTIEEQVGGQLKAGFKLEDIYSDTNGDGYLHSLNVPTFYATKSLK